MSIHREAATVQLACEGDGKAWVELYSRYSGMLAAIGRGYRLDRDEVADAMQSTWLLLFQYFKHLRDPKKLPGWLSCTMRRECMRMANRPRCVPLPEELHSRDSVDYDVPGVALLFTERNRTLWDAVDRLPARQRAVLMALACTPTPSYAEVSRQLSVAVGTIGPTRAKALRTLRTILAGTDIDARG
jgi:RNA polymerase sigma factor (sigma-70 family)